MVVDLGDRSSEPILQLGLGGLDVLPLPFQRARLGEVQLDGEDPDVARPHGAIETLGLRLRGRGRRRLVERRPLDLAGLVGLDHVAFLQVVEPLEKDAALKAFRDLTGVVLEALELSDRGLVDDGAVPDEADLGPAPDQAAGDHAARNRPEPRDLEELTDLRLAERLLLLDRLEHADEGLLDVLGELVDHAVGADLDALSFRERPRLRVRAYVETDDGRGRGRSEHDVVLGDAADALVDDAHAHLGMLDLPELRNGRLDRADDVALDHEVQILDGACLHLLEEAFDRDALGCLRELLPAQPLSTSIGEVTSAPLVFDDATQFAGRGRMVEAEDFDRIAGVRLLHLVATVV